MVTEKASSLSPHGTSAVVALTGGGAEGLHRHILCFGPASRETPNQADDEGQALVEEDLVVRISLSAGP